MRRHVEDDDDLMVQTSTRRHLNSLISSFVVVACVHILSIAV